MPRRARRSTAEDILDLASRLPWWVSALLAIASYLLLSRYTSLPSPAAGVTSTADIASAMIPTFLRGVATAAQYLLPLLFGVAAVVSGVRKLNRSSSSPEKLEESTSRVDSSLQAPSCPQCDAPMMQRRAKRGVNAGNTFWGCSNYPRCQGTRALD